MVSGLGGNGMGVLPGPVVGVEGKGVAKVRLKGGWIVIGQARVESVFYWLMR